MYNFEVLTVAPISYGSLHQLAHAAPCNVREGLWKNSIMVFERDLQGFGLHLPLVLGVFEAGADNNSEAVVISQRVPDWVNKLLLRVATNKA